MKDSRKARLLMRAPYGVTLVELMIVVVIIGILAAIATPSVRRTRERANARAFAAEIANSLRTARNQAMSRGIPVYVQLGAGDGTSDDRGTVITSVPTPGGGSERSCRETPAGYLPVADAELNEKSGAVQLTQIDPLFTTLCFSPDGRILTASGSPITSGTIPCPGENMVIMVADSVATTAEVETAAACGSAVDDREVFNVYRVVVPYNGAIRVE